MAGGMSYAAAREHLDTPVDVLAYLRHLVRLRAARAEALGKPQ